jgi:hypothetical protein
MMKFKDVLNKAGRVFKTLGRFAKRAGLGAGRLAASGFRKLTGKGKQDFAAKESLNNFKDLGLAQKENLLNKELALGIKDAKTLQQEAKGILLGDKKLILEETKPETKSITTLSGEKPLKENFGGAAAISRESKLITAEGKPEAKEPFPQIIKPAGKNTRPGM